MYKIGPSTEPCGTPQREAFDWWSAHLPLWQIGCGLSSRTLTKKSPFRWFQIDVQVYQVVCHDLPCRKQRKVPVTRVGWLSLIRILYGLNDRPLWSRYPMTMTILKACENSRRHFRSLEASNLDHFWRRPSQTIWLWFFGGRVARDAWKWEKIGKIQKAFSCGRPPNLHVYYV